MQVRILIYRNSPIVYYLCYITIVLPSQVVHKIALMCDDISSAKIATKPRFDNAKCKYCREPFPKAVKLKRIPTRATKVWANVAQTRLGGEFWACDVIVHKTCYHRTSGSTRMNFNLNTELVLSFDTSLCLVISRNPSTWPVNNCLQIMVCSCVVPSKCGLLLVCIVTTLFTGVKNGRSLLNCQRVI